MTTERLTTTEVARTLLAQRGWMGGQSAVSLTRNARGITQIEVTVKAEDGQSADDASETCKRIYDALASAYPLPEGTNGS